MSIEVRFNITPDGINNMPILDFEAFERVQDGQFRSYRVRPAMARFMVDENDQPLEYSKAIAITEKLTVANIRDFVSKFFTTMHEAALPKESVTP